MKYKVGDKVKYKGREWIIEDDKQTWSDPKSDPVYKISYGGVDQLAYESDLEPYVAPESTQESPQVTKDFLAWLEKKHGEWLRTIQAPKPNPDTMTINIKLDPLSECCEDIAKKLRVPFQRMNLEMAIASTEMKLERLKNELDKLNEQTTEG